MSHDHSQNFLRQMKREGIDMTDAVAVHDRLRKGCNDPSTRKSLRNVLRRMSRSLTPVLA